MFGDANPGPSRAMYYSAPQTAKPRPPKPHLNGNYQQAPRGMQNGHGAAKENGDSQQQVAEQANGAAGVLPLEAQMSKLSVGDN